MLGRLSAMEKRGFVAVLFCSVLISLLLTGITYASNTPVGPDDWRYHAMAELARAGLLEPGDALLYSSGASVPMDTLTRSVLKMLDRLGPQATAAGPTGVLALGRSPSGANAITREEASLVAGLAREFAPASAAATGLSLGDLSDVVANSRVVNLQSLIGGSTEGLAPLRLDGHAGAATVRLPGAADTSAATSGLNNALSQTLPKDSEAQNAQVQVGLPSPIGTVAVELSSQAAHRPPASSQKKAEGPAPPGFDIATTVQLSDVLKVSAEFFRDDKSVEKATSTAVGVLIGEKEGTGLSVGHRVTDVATPASAAGHRETVTSVGVKYALPDAVTNLVGSDNITVRAGYELYGRDSRPTGAEKKDSLQATASLGIDYKLLLGDAAFLQAGYRYENVRDLIASGAVWTKSGLYDDGGFLDWPARESLTLDGSNNATRTVASIDFGYKLMGEASLMVGYQLIDFSDTSAVDPKNLASAEVTIRF